MTLDQALERVRHHLHTVQTTDPSRFSPDKLSEFFHLAMHEIAQRLPDKVAGNLFVTDYDIDITTSDKFALSGLTNFQSFRELRRASDGFPASYLDKDKFQGITVHRKFGRYSIDDQTLYCTIRGNYLVVHPHLAWPTAFKLDYRRLPTEASLGHDIDLPEERFVDWVCMYTAYEALVSVGKLQKAQVMAQRLNTAVKTANIREMIPPIDVADTQQEQQAAGATA